MAAVLAARAPFGLWLAVYGLYAVYVQRFLSQDDRDWGHFAKMTLLLPAGLGTLLSYRVWFDYARYLGPFSMLINTAVLVNIAMMALLPNTSSALRGRLHRPTCLALVAWLWLEMSSVGFLTCEFSPSGLFVFNSSPMAWILLHACYRFVMITLPNFDSQRYLTLELYSLSTMCFLSWLDHGAHGPESYFGYADSIVVPSVAITSALFPMEHRPSPRVQALLASPRFDALCAAVQCLVLAVSLQHIVELTR